MPHFKAFGMRNLQYETAQMAQKEEFMFQNVAYRPTVYRTGYVTFRWFPQS